MATHDGEPIARLLQTLRGLVARRRRLQALAFEVAAAEARERERIADGLHDDIGQALAMVNFKLAELASKVEAAGSDPVMQELRALVARATEAARHATFELRSPVLQQLGLQAALESLAQRMHRLCGLHIELRGQLDGLALPAPVQSIVFRVVRELLLNVRKHAHARKVLIWQGSASGRPLIRVQDDGVGFERGGGPWRFSAEGGYGLHSAEAQMAAVGGQLSVSSKPGHGTCAQLWLPASPAPAGRRLFRGHRPALDEAWPAPGTVRNRGAMNMVRQGETQ